METDQNGSWMDLVQRSWNLLAAKKAISDIEVQYVSVNRRTEFTMDMLIEGIYFVVRLKFFCGPSHCKYICRTRTSLKGIMLNIESYCNVVYSWQ